MQNGRIYHRGHRVRVSIDYNWADGGNPNAAPFYMSTAGYGVYRNTWSPGYYDFTQGPAVLAHNESRYDAFFIAAKPLDYAALLEGYTWVTGRPFMPPAYGLGLGDSDCYHNTRHGNDTNVVKAVASKYREMRLPASWFLPNDGYGCGFGKGDAVFPSDFDTLDEVVKDLNQQGFQVGLWSSTGLPNISREVAGSGTRIGKTDVGWIGDGYRYAFESVDLVVRGIEDNSDARRFVWTVEGWAGTHRNAVMWSGDDSGSFDYIRWQVPSFAGAGFSAQAHVSGDIDGIYGGSAETYVRDLQFKCMMTVLMVMSGWAPNPDKQPWTWGEPYTSINRQYLELKARLFPYHYTLSRMAFDTGMPPIRAMALEFPEDPVLRTNFTGSAEQFMSGPAMLVAPVYHSVSESAVRNDIYLPTGTWVDFWNGTVFQGPTTLQNYDAPLDKLPMLVRAGSIIPSYPLMQYPGEKPASELVLDVYPSGNTGFRVYEDDGVTRKAVEGKEFAWTQVTVTAATRAMDGQGDVEVMVGAVDGSFTGMVTARSYNLQVHMAHGPANVTVAGKFTPQRRSRAELDFTAEGWYYDKSDRGGVAHVRVGSTATSQAVEVVLLASQAVLV